MAPSAKFLCMQICVAKPNHKVSIKLFHIETCFLHLRTNILINSDSQLSPYFAKLRFPICQSVLPVSEVCQCTTSDTCISRVNNSRKIYKCMRSGKPSSSSPGIIRKLKKKTLPNCQTGITWIGLLSVPKSGMFSISSTWVPASILGYSTVNWLHLYLWIGFVR